MDELKNELDEAYALGDRIDRAYRLTNLQMWTMVLQNHRIRESDPIDDEFIFRRVADIQFLILTYWRFGLAAEIVNDFPEIGQALQPFREALKSVKHMRDVIMHIDEYATGSGRYSEETPPKAVDRLYLNDEEFEWLDKRVNYNEIFRFASEVFQSILDVKDAHLDRVRELKRQLEDQGRL